MKCILQQSRELLIKYAEMLQLDSKLHLIPHKTQRETSNAREATQKKMFLITALICTDKARTKIHKNTLLCQLSCLHCKYYRNIQGS